MAVIHGEMLAAGASNIGVQFPASATKQSFDLTVWMSDKGIKVGN
jgi:hypothetical protein